MKLNTILVAGACASVLFTTSCQPSMGERQLKYTHTTLVDKDAYNAIRIIGGKVPYELDYASHVEANGTSEDKALAAKVQATFAGMLAELDTLATKNQVDFPVLGAKQFKAENSEHTAEHVAATDSTAAVAHTDHAEHGHAHGAADHYQHHVQHEVASIKDQFTRLSRNTNKELRDYAASKLEALSELYKQAGGTEEAGGHH